MRRNDLRGRRRASAKTTATESERVAALRTGRRINYTASTEYGKQTADVLPKNSSTGLIQI